MVRLFIFKAQNFFDSFCDIVKSFTPRVKELIHQRTVFYKGLDKCLKEDPAGLSQWLSESEFIEIPKDIESNCSVKKETVDPEIRSIPGPQLVVPLTNARYSLNAVNSRWRSLYDALYGSNVFSNGDEKAQQCVKYVNDLLNEWFPIESGTWSNSGEITVVDAKLKVSDKSLKSQDQYLGMMVDNVSCFVLAHNGLMVKIVVDRETELGKSHPLGISNVILESSLTSIMDGEDSVAAVDEEDKMTLYSNWKGLMEHTLKSTFERNGGKCHRKLNEDGEIKLKDGTLEKLNSRAVMLVRVVGLFIKSDLIRIGDQLVPETLIDVMIYALISYWVESSTKTDQPNNSKTGSIYFVVPKMHGSAEVKMIIDLFASVEVMIGAPEYTLKIGIMDEEVRTSVNLENCLKEAKDRVIFINTGFLDRTGDQIYTLSSHGPFAIKDHIKIANWLKCYEERNVSTGLNFGLYGKAQIGKGMWAAPDDMLRMMKEKVGHVRSGANTAWVPSPTAACLHAIHYHNIDVYEEVKGKMNSNMILPEALLQSCVVPEAELNGWKESINSEITKSNSLEQYAEQAYKSVRENRADINPIMMEVLNNVQCIVGYTSRWVILGIGCSKILNMEGIALMEDRATLRISSQHLANWLSHGVIDEQLVKAAIVCIVKEVDTLNLNEPGWTPMGDPNAEDGELSPACRAIGALCLKGSDQTSGYTEPILYGCRKLQKFQIKNSLK